MNRLVKRLRNAGDDLAGFDGSGGLYHEAADRIEELEKLHRLSEQYDAADDDAYWEPPHPIFQMAHEIDFLSSALTNALNRGGQLERKMDEMERQNESLKELAKELSDQLDAVTNVYWKVQGDTHAAGVYADGVGYVLTLLAQALSKNEPKKNLR